MSVNLALTRSWTQLETPNRQTLKQVFKTIDADSCPFSYNFHMHTIFSDGQLKPEEVMEQAIEYGIQGLAITDHHSIGGYQVAKSWLEDWHWKHPNDFSAASPVPTLWSGIEINANLLKTEVHILGYGFNPEHPSLFPYITGKAPKKRNYQADRVIAAIQEAGGVAVLAHPCRYRVSAAKLIPEAASLGIDGVETYYGYVHTNPWSATPKQTRLVQQLAKDYRLFSSCGTDSHGKSILVRL